MAFGFETGPENVVSIKVVGVGGGVKVNVLFTTNNEW